VSDVSRRRKFEVAGDTYEVRAAPFENGWQVQCFKGDSTFGPRYGMSWDNHWAFKVTTATDPVDELMLMAERDVRAYVEGDNA
jgi:hypothetical protein